MIDSDCIKKRTSDPDEDEKEFVEFEIPPYYDDYNQDE